MGIGTGLAVGIGAVASVGSAAIGASAAEKAANAQVNAANQAANLQHQDAQDSLAFQNKEWEKQQQNAQPWISAGQGALSQINTDLNNGTYGDFTGQFTAPTGATEQNDPGYQFRLNEGMKALDRGAAARGGLLTGGTAKAEQQYGQDYASNEYNNVYNRAFGQFQDSRNQFYANQANRFNRYAAISGLGQQTMSQLGNQGQAAAGNVANINLTSGQQIGQDYQNAGAARASGYVGQANAMTSGLGNLSSLAWLGLSAANQQNQPCWVAAELYGGWDAPQTKAIRSFLTTKFNKTKLGADFVAAYEKNGQKVAQMVKDSPELREFIKPVFDQFLAASEVA